MGHWGRIRGRGGSAKIKTAGSCVEPRRSLWSAAVLLKGSSGCNGPESVEEEGWGRVLRAVALKSVQGRDYWGVVEPGCVAKSRPGRSDSSRGCEQGAAAPLQTWVRRSSVAPTDRGVHQGFSHKHTATGSAYWGPTTRATAVRGRRERRQAVRRTLRGATGSVSLAGGARGRQRYLGLHAQHNPAAVAVASAGLAAGSCSLSPAGQHGHSPKRRHATHHPLSLAQLDAARSYGHHL